MSKFKRVMTDLNVTPLLAQIAENPDLWNTDSVRTSKTATVHYAVDDIILRFPGRGENWNCHAFNVLTEAQDIVFRLCSEVRCELLGRVIISRLAPGKSIPRHPDRMPDGRPLFYSRYQIPLQGRSGVEFHVEDEQLYMEPGNIYWFANHLEHWVINNSDTDRISMVVDIRSFTPWSG